MKNLRLIPAAVVLASLVFAPVMFAAKADGPKAKAMAKYDLNHDGKLDEAELATVQKDFAADPKGDLARFDADKDGKLSNEEMAKMVPGSGGKKVDGEKKAKAEGEKKSGGKKSEKSESK